MDGVEEAGYWSAEFDAAGLASGVYIYRMTAGLHTQARKIMLVH